MQKGLVEHWVAIDNIRTLHGHFGAPSFREVNGWVKGNQQKQQPPQNVSQNE